MSCIAPFSARVFTQKAFQTVDKALQKGYNKTIDGKGATRCKTLLPLPFFVYLLSPRGAKDTKGERYENGNRIFRLYGL